MGKWAHAGGLNDDPFKSRRRICGWGGETPKFQTNGYMLPFSIVSFYQGDYYWASLSVPPRKVTAAYNRELSWVEIFQCNSWSKKTLLTLLLTFEDINSVKESLLHWNKSIYARNDVSNHPAIIIRVWLAKFPYMNKLLLPLVIKELNKWELNLLPGKLTF